MRNGRKTSSAYSRLNTFVFLFIAVLCTCHGASGQDNVNRTRIPPEVDKDIVRIDTALVTIPVNVVDRQGNFLANLRREQFRIFEDGIEQEVAFFEDSEKAFTVAIVLDVSDSTKFKLKEIQDAAFGFIQQLRSDDRVILIAFDSKVTPLSGITSDRTVLMEALRRIRTGGGTSVYNAVYATIGDYMNRVQGRKAVVLFSDGVDTSSLSATYKSTLQLAEESGSIFYTIRYDTYIDVTEKARSGAFSQEQMSLSIRGEPAAVVYERAKRYLSSLAESTGGHMYSAGTMEHLSRAFAHIVGELRQQYSVGFYPKNQETDGLRRIKVGVSIPKAVVSTRKSYVFKTMHGTKKKP